MVSELDAARLRRLAGLRPEGAKVISLYLDLDPQQFATGEARASEITSLLDQAAHLVEEAGLEHGARVAAREDLKRAREEITPDDLDAKGALGLAIFICGPADLFEQIKLPRPVGSAARLGDSPWVEPLVGFAGERRVAVSLIDGEHHRLFHGTPGALEEINPGSIALRRSVDQGGAQEQRHPRPSQEDLAQHLERASHALLALLKTRGYDALLLGARQELRSEVLDKLHPYVRERLAGDVSVDMSSANAATVQKAAAEVLAQLRERETDDAFARLREGIGRDGRAAAGLTDVLDALVQRRVEILIYPEGFAAPGVICPADGWMGASGSTCPVDGTTLEQRENILENAAESAVLQDARVLVVGDPHRDELSIHGNVAAVLRF